MKLRALVAVMSLSCVGLVSCEEGGDAAAEQPTEAKPAEPAAPAEPAKAEQTPQQACTELVAGAKANDEAKVTSMLAPGGAEALAAEGAKEPIMTWLGGVTCG